MSRITLTPPRAAWIDKSKGVIPLTNPEKRVWKLPIRIRAELAEVNAHIAEPLSWNGTVLAERRKEDQSWRCCGDVLCRAEDVRVELNTIAHWYDNIFLKDRSPILKHADLVPQRRRSLQGRIRLALRQKKYE